MKTIKRFAPTRLALNIVTTLALLAMMLGTPVTAFAAAPSNDDFDYPVAVSASPMTLTMSEASFNAAVNGLNDPDVCGSVPGVHTVWYSFVPTANGKITVSTAGSSFDTVLAIWTGTRGNLASVACNDDTATGLQAELTSITLQPYVRYYIEVIQYTGGGGPQKSLAPTAENFPSPSPSASWLTLTVSYSTTLKVLNPGKYDDKSTLLTYAGTWTNVSNASAYLGGYKYSSTINMSCTFVIKGNQFKVFYTTTPQMGNMNVFVDGVLVSTIVQTSATTAYQQVYSYNGPALADGLHIVQLKNLTKRVNIDAIEVFAPPDLVPPATISNLSAATGTAFGAVNLSWTAPGDDGLDNPASSYDVRYSSNPIVDLSSWNAATKVTSGVTAPKLPGAAESLTVTGLTPGFTYYFAVRTLDEPAPDATPSDLSNSPSAASYFAGPYGSGLYNDIAAGWMYAGTWTANKSTSAYKGDYHTSSVVGNSASFVFVGTQFNFYYLMNSYGGIVDVRVDGVSVTQINQKSNTAKWQQKYTGASLSGGQHTLQLVHLSGSKIYVEYIEIVGVPDSDPPLAISNLGAASGVAGASVDLTWTAVAEDATGSLPADTYLVRYSTSDIVDETTWNAASNFSNTLAPKSPGQAESLAVTGLVPGALYYFAVRAVDESGNVGALGPSSSATASPLPSAGPGTYENTSSFWIYSGFSQVNNTSASGLNFHRSTVIGNTATFAFTGTAFKLVYGKNSLSGNLEVWVDGTLVGTINQQGVTVWKVQSILFSVGPGTHLVVFRHASGSATNVDAIIIQ